MATSQPSQRDLIDATNSRIDRLTGWFDRLIPFRSWRPLDMVPSIKLKLSILILAAIAMTVVISTVGFWLNIKPRFTLLLSVALALVLVQILARGITSPLRDMSRAVDAMAAGELDQRVTATGRDEVAQLARSFNEMTTQISELERQRSELIANVSHELRTPIAVLQGNLENLADGVVSSEDNIETMLRQTKRLGRLVSQILDLSRLEAGASRLDSLPLDLMDLISQVVNDIGSEVAIVVEGPDRLEIMGDAERLHQVLTNLIDNALRFAPSDMAIEIFVAHSDAEVTLLVEDSGPGIPAAELDRIFERFHRGDNEWSGGAGLGLAICRSIVELHGGSIRAANRDPCGAVIEIVLPALPNSGF